MVAKNKKRVSFDAVQVRESPIGSDIRMAAKNKKRVSFDTVQVREYPIVLGLNPSTRSGPAIEIGWEYRYASDIPPVLDEEKTVINAVEDGLVPVNEYERIRPSSLRRNDKKLYVYVNKREEYVKKNGFTEDEIKQARKDNRILHKQRERSNLTLSLLGECKKKLRSFRRHKKVKRAVRNLQKSKEESGSADTIYNGWWIPLSAHMF